MADEFVPGDRVWIVDGGHMVGLSGVVSAVDDDYLVEVEVKVKQSFSREDLRHG